jgi:hypothetical protein
VKRIVAQLLKKFPPFMELESSLPCLLEPVSGPDEFGPQPPNLFL